MTMPVIRARAGMSLLECLAYVAVLAVVVNLAASAFISNSRLALVGTKALDKLWQAGELEAEFARTVHEAKGVAESVGSYRSGADQLVLELPPLTEEGQDARYVVFVSAGTPSRLTRMEIAMKNGQAGVERSSIYTSDITSLKFGYDSTAPKDAKLLTLDLATQGARGGKGNPVTCHLLASFRGTGGGAVGGGAS